eukprot:NODE_99_length_20465_cov_0.827654.p6 type:complete len:254 gc:universal NODE_99_length_20465_cov_0.827654:10944-11705(+)
MLIMSFRNMLLINIVVCINTYITNEVIHTYSTKLKPILSKKCSAIPSEKECTQIVFVLDNLNLQQGASIINQFPHLQDNDKESKIQFYFNLFKQVLLEQVQCDRNCQNEMRQLDFTKIADIVSDLQISQELTDLKFKESENLIIDLMRSTIDTQLAYIQQKLLKSNQIQLQKRAHNAIPSIKRKSYYFSLAILILAWMDKLDLVWYCRSLIMYFMAVFANAFTNPYYGPDDKFGLFVEFTILIFGYFIKEFGI